jgi:predicted RNase H-like HicB family nuclease
MKVRAIFERSPDGLWLADVPELPGCSVSGETIDEARQRLREARAVHVPDGEPLEMIEELFGAEWR